MDKDKSFKKVSDIVAEILVEENVSHVFAISGGMFSNVASPLNISSMWSWKNAFLDAVIGGWLRASSSVNDTSAKNCALLASSLSFLIMSSSKSFLTKPSILPKTWSNEVEGF